MGDGPRVEPGVLTEEMIEEAAQKALANFGKADSLLFPPGLLKSIRGLKGSGNWYTPQYPEYSGTPWAHRDHLNKREHTIARLHTFLKKLGALKHIKEEEFESIKDLSVKRLKRANWART